jgi:hypothetical protein
VKIAGQGTYQFTSVSTTRTPTKRIDGYEQAIGSGASLTVAKAAVLKLLPSDTKATSFRIVHERRRWDAVAGDSCVIWELMSATLGRLMGGGTPHESSHAGPASVILFTTDSNYLPEFRSHDVSNAIVIASAIPKDGGC